MMMMMMMIIITEYVYNRIRKTIDMLIGINSVALRCF